MIDRKALIDWAKTLHPESSVGIDDDGIALIEIDKKGDETGAYIEVGGVPRVGPEDFPDGETARTPTPGLTVACNKCVGLMPGISVSPDRIECAECGEAI